MVKRDKIIRWVWKPISAPQTPNNLTGWGQGGIFWSLPCLRGGGGGRWAVATSSCTNSCSHCKSVYCSQVPFKINSQRQHQQKALTDCRMCWHSYKLLDKKSNTLSLFSSLYNNQSCFQEKTWTTFWDAECHLQSRMAASGGDGFGREKKVDPSFERKRGGKPLTTLSYNWSRWLFFL